MRTLGLIALLAGCQEALPPADFGEPVDTAAPTPSGDALFGLACAACHGPDGRGGSGGPDLADRARDLTIDEVQAVILEGSGFMDPVPLDEQEALAVADHVITFVVPVE